MKANELMIGDWVQCTYWHNPHILQVYELKRAGDDELKIVVVEDVLPLVFQEMYIEPIPLTAEILEKNGYVKDEDIRGYVSSCHRFIFHYEDEFKNTGHSWYVHVDNNCFNSIGSIELTYVHQFQQFLRLCEYSDIADNLKI